MEKIIKINEKSYTIKKASLGKYKVVLEGLKNLPTDKLSNIDTLDNNTFLRMLPELLFNSYDDVVKILSALTDISIEELEEEIDLYSAIELFQAVLEVNDFKSLGKVMGNLYQTSNPQKITGLKK